MDFKRGNKKQRKPHSKMKYSIADCMHISQMKYWRKYEALDLIYKNHNSTINECFQLLVLGYNKTNYFQP